MPDILPHQMTLVNKNNAKGKKNNDKISSKEKKVISKYIFWGVDIFSGGISQTLTAS